MKLGAIDVGTNSCRMLIVDYYQGRYQVLKQGLITTRLGEGVARTGLLKEKAIERALKAIKNFLWEMRKAGVEKVTLVGTSALRDVKNAGELTARLEQETGNKLKIISGREEARLIYTGVSIDLTGDDFLIIDIGGGSTEFIWQEAKQVVFKSLNIGAVRMTEGYISDPVKPVDNAELKVLKEAVNDKLTQLKNNHSFRAIGLGGTITTLAAIDLEMQEYESVKIHRYKLTRDKVKEILARLSKLYLDERKEIPGLQPERADIIIAGTMILQTIMEKFQLAEITISEHGILYGIIREMS